MIFLPHAAEASPPKLPPAYYRLSSPTEKAVFLRRIIGDSVTNGTMESVAELCHLTLHFLRTAPNDTVLPMIYQFLADAHDAEHTDSAAIYFRAALSAWKSPSLSKRIYLQQSLLYDFIALEEKDSVRALIRSLEQTISSLPASNSMRLSSLNTIAQGYSALNMYERTIGIYRVVIRQAFLTQDSITLLNALVNTGTAYNENDDDRQAIFYTLQALPYLPVDPFTRMITFTNLTDYYSSLSVMDSARIFLRMAEKIATESGDPAAIANMKVRRAAIHIGEGNYALAEPLLESSLATFASQEPDLNYINCLLVYASLDTAVRNYERADRHLRTLYKITSEKNLKVYAVENARMLSVVNARLGNYADAYAFSQQFIALNAEVRTEKAAESFAALQSDYDAYKREEQITLLQKESRIKDLEIRAFRRNAAWLIALAVILLAATGGILYFRGQRNRSAMSDLKTGLEMKALRSQMNPHFIFNSLNSIQKYIWENKQEDAAAYLTRFARLIRLVLENSQHATVPLREELDALRLYIEMEHRRNNQRFDYAINVSPDIDVEKVNIPPLLLQPYVENAIWHGLSQKETRGMLSIEIWAYKNVLHCAIDDDGIGRTAAAAIRAAAPVEGKSLAMNISAQRLAWIQKDSGTPAFADIVDKYESGRSTGTAVHLTIPIAHA